MRTRIPRIPVMAMFLAVMFMMAVASQADAAYSVRQTFARISGTAGEALTTGDVVCIKDADGEVYKADADDADLRPAVGIVGKSAAENGQVEIIVSGVLTGWSTLSEGQPGYLSETAGAVTQIMPTYGQQVGIAIDATTYFFSFNTFTDTSALTGLGILTGATPLIFEGATANDHETTIAVTDPTADRTITLPNATGAVTLSTLTTNSPDVANSVWLVSNGIVFEGATADAHETTVTPTDPTADRTVTLADASGTVFLSTLATNGPEAANSVWGASNGLVFEGATADAFETTITPTDPTADRTITIPDRSGSVALEIRSVTASTTGPVAVTTASLGQILTNSGAGGGVLFNLPEASTWIGGCIEFAVIEAQNFDINPDDADVLLGITNAAGDAIRSATAGDNICLCAIDATNIIAKVGRGTWADIN